MFPPPVLVALEVVRVMSLATERHERQELEELYREVALEIRSRRKLDGQGRVSVELPAAIRRLQRNAPMLLLKPLARPAVGAERDGDTPVPAPGEATTSAAGIWHRTGATESHGATHVSLSRGETVWLR